METKTKNTGEETHQAEPGVVGEKGKNMIRIEKTEDAEKYIRDGVLKIDGDILFAGDDVNIPAKILCKNIYSEKYPRNIYAYDIKARVINAWDIKAKDINAQKIQYYGFCIAYSSMKYENIEARRKKHICLVLDEKSD